MPPNALSIPGGKFGQRRRNRLIGLAIGCRVFSSYSEVVLIRGIPQEFYPWHDNVVDLQREPDCSGFVQFTKALDYCKKGTRNLPTRNFAQQLWEPWRD